jgi:CubicO group peptidase (beta-lactamase class C family)
MEYDASWSIDSRKDKTEKAFCCINARARDFAKFGRLFLHNGNWNGKQIISENWVKQSTQFVTEKNNYIYSYQWWHNPKYTSSGIEAGNDFYAHGLLGQYIYVYPSKNIIIVRLGKKEGNVDWSSLFLALAEKN